MKKYGIELTIDLKNCDVSLFNKRALKRYLKQLCELIDMKICKIHFWEYENSKERKEAPSHLAGISVCCFISTSNIIIHTLDKMKSVYFNIFTCKDFNTNKAIKFTKSFFKGKVKNYNIINRL